MPKETEAATESTAKNINAEPTSVAGVEHSADATAQFCRHCGAAMESGSTLCGHCGTHKIHPDRLKILSRLIDEATATRFCTQCGARAIEGEPFCHKCGQQIGKLNPETPSANAVPAPAHIPAVAKAQTQLNSDASGGLRGLPEVAAEGYETATYPKESSLRHALRRHPNALTGGTIVLVVAAAVITWFLLRHPQSAYVPSVTRDARQSAPLASGGLAKAKPSGAIAAQHPSRQPAANDSAPQDRDTSSVGSNSKVAGHDDRGVVPSISLRKTDSYADIQNTLDGWAEAMNDNDVTSQRRYYSDRLDRYFLARHVTRMFVLQDKARFYRKGNLIVAFHIDNVRVEKQSAQQATVSLMKHWKIFDGLRTKPGETRSRLWLTRRVNQWQITGEQDLTTQEANR